MGCASSFPTQVSSMPVKKKRISNATIITLLDNTTDLEKTVVRKTWKYINRDLSKYGSYVFLKIFQMRPELKDIFPFDDKENDRNFTGHATRFMQVVGTAIDMIDDWDEVFTNLLLGLGRQHNNFEGFHPEYFEDFTEAMLQVWEEVLGDRFTIVVRNSWCRVFDFIILKLMEGYNIAKAEQFTNNDCVEAEKVTGNDFVKTEQITEKDCIKE